MHCHIALGSLSTGSISPPCSSAIRGEHGTRHDDGLLVRQRDALPGPERLDGREQSHIADGGCDDRVDLGIESHLDHGGAGRSSIQDRGRVSRRAFAVDQLGPELPDLRFEELYAAPRGQANNAQSAGKRPYDVERLRAYGARRAKYRKALH